MPTEPTEERKLAAIMFTDMVGYSALAQRDDKVALELLEEHRRILRNIFPRFHGTEIKTIGDAFLVEFGSALEAAQCAIEIQRALAKRNTDVAADRHIAIKIGIHIGDVVHRDGDVYGDGVNIASRIEQLAGAGGIAVSMDVERQIRNALEARFEKFAVADLKNIKLPMELFRIVLPWEAGEKPRGEPYAPKRSGLPFLLPAAVFILLALLAGWWFMPRSGRDPSPHATDKSIAVLPFDNLSPDPENAFFADGVQDEILTDLSRIADLKVISRSSVMHYKSGVERNLRKISQELGVAHVLEGSVQRAANRVRVNAQLIDARNDAHLWAQTYDRDLADVFAIQSEIAKTIADQLQAKLSPGEISAISQPPTNDLVAFDLYTRAKDLILLGSSGNSGNTDLLRAIELLNQAVTRDPSFFDAFCLLADAHDTLYAFGFDHTPARLQAAAAAIDAAARLRPDAGQTHLARAQHVYQGYLDYSGALSELEPARQKLPNDSRVYQLMGFIQRRQKGHYEEGTKTLEHALELNPRDELTLIQIAAFNYRRSRRHAAAASAWDRLLSIRPDDVNAMVGRAGVDFDWKADTRSLHQTIEAIRTTTPGEAPRIAIPWLTCALAERDAAAAKNALNALGEAPVLLSSENVIFSRAFAEGLIARMTHDEAAARSCFAVARAQQEKVLAAQPNYAPAICVMSLIDAGLGRKEDALREGRRAVELLPVEKDQPEGLDMVKYFAMAAGWVGDKDLAFQQLAIAAAGPSGLSYGELKLLPMWEPLRGDERFEKIVTSFAPQN